MVRTLIGDLFASKAQTLVNTVNCVGVMGKGIALEFKKRFPEMYEDYAARCEKGAVRLGRPYLFKTASGPWVLNFPTKNHWRSVSNISDIVRGLDYLEEHCQGWGITSLAVPPLGCGHGQLEWGVVGPTLYRHLRRLQVPVEIYAPYQTPPAQLEMAFLAEQGGAEGTAGSKESTPKIAAAHIALVEILARILREPYHWPIGRVMLQKLAYFATESGLPTGLTYGRGSYGPFSVEVKPLIAKLVNNGLIEEIEAKQMFVYRTGSTYQDIIVSHKADLKRWEPIINRVVDLLVRLRTSQAEIAATVHFAAQSLERELCRRPSETAVLHAVKQWKQKRRPPLSDAEIGQGIRTMNLLGWVNLEFSRDLPLLGNAVQDDEALVLPPCSPERVIG